MRFVVFYFLFQLLCSASFSQDVKVRFDVPGENRGLRAESVFYSLKLSFENEFSSEKVASIKISDSQQKISQEIVLPPNSQHVERIPYWSSMDDRVQIEIKVDDKVHNYSFTKYLSSYGSSTKSLADTALVLAVTDEMKSLGNLMVEKKLLLNGTNLNRADYQSLPKTATDLAMYDIIVVDRLEFEKKHSQAKALLQSYVGQGGSILFLNSDDKKKFEWEKSSFGHVYHLKNKSNEYIVLDSMIDSGYTVKEFIKDFASTNQTSFLLENDSTFYLISLGIFTLFAGGFNFFYLHKINKTFLIYFTMPILSIIFCGFILITYVFQEGSKRLTNSTSITFLDAINENATTVARSVSYRSFAMDKGVEMPLHAYCMPMSVYRYNRYGSDYVVDREDVQVLSGSYYSSRSENSFASYSQANSSLSSKLIENANERLLVKSGLPYEAEFFLIDAANMSFYYGSNALVRPESQVNLSLLKDKISINQFKYSMPENLLRFLKTRPGKYLIAKCNVSDFAPFGNDLSYKHQDSKHFIIQRLD